MIRNSGQNKKIAALSPGCHFSHLQFVVDLLFYLVKPGQIIVCYIAIVQVLQVFKI